MCAYAANGSLHDVKADFLAKGSIHLNSNSSSFSPHPVHLDVSLRPQILLRQSLGPQQHLFTYEPTAGGWSRLLYEQHYYPLMG